MWLHRVKKAYGEGLEVTWRWFSLEQVNSKEEGWKVWEQPEDYKGRSIWSLRAGAAAKRQGPEAFERYHLALLTARHAGRRVPLNEKGPLIEVAGEVGLDVARFRQDLEDRALLEEIARDHTEAVEKYGVFGTPTFIFEDGGAAFLKIFIPPEEESVPFFQEFYSMFGRRPYVGEVKRPQPPWPKGAVR